MDFDSSGLNTSLPPHLGLSLPPSIPTHAADSPGLLGFELLRQYHVPLGTQLLLCHHLAGLQRFVAPSLPTYTRQATKTSTSFTISQPHRSPTGADSCSGHTLVH